jgi:anti-anti-sigma regulatory factor
MVVAKQLRARQTPFVICELSPNVREVFEISGFDRVLRVAATRAEALAGVGPRHRSAAATATLAGVHERVWG